MEDRPRKTLKTEGYDAQIFIEGELPVDDREDTDRQQNVITTTVIEHDSPNIDLVDYQCDAAYLERTEAYDETEDIDIPPSFVENTVRHYFNFSDNPPFSDSLTNETFPLPTNVSFSRPKPRVRRWPRLKYQESNEFLRYSGVLRQPTLRYIYQLDYMGITSYLIDEYIIVDDSKIASIVVLYRREHHVEAVTCGEHLNSLLGSDVSQQLLKCLASCCRRRPFSFQSDEISIEACPSSGTGSDQIVIRSSGALAAIPIALKFLVGTLRSSLPGHICESNAYATNEKHTGMIHCRPLIKMDVTSCWSCIFSAKVVYSDESTYNGESETSGVAVECALPLKIPLEWLADFSGVKSWTETAGGVCLAGPRSVLIPMKKVLAGAWPGSYTLHWHLVHIIESSRRNGRSLRYSLMCEVLAFIKREVNWQREETPEALLQGVSTHMVSWSEAVKCSLGSVDQTYSLRRSRCERVPLEAEDRSENMSFAFGYGGPSIGVGIIVRLGRNERAIPRQKDSVEWLLEDAKDELVILYNPEAKQAWVVSRSAVIRHLVIAYCLKQRNIDVLPEPLSRLYEGTDPQSCLSSNLKLETGLEGPKTVAELVEALLYAVDNVKLNQPDASSSRYFYGYEARDLVYRRQKSSLSGADLSKNGLFSLPGKAGWHKLVSEIPVIFFCGWEDPIVPEVWANFQDKLPRGQDLLAISMSDLEILLLTHNDENLVDGKIGPDAYWTCDPFRLNEHAGSGGSMRKISDYLIKPHTISSSAHYTRRLSSLRTSFPMAGLAFLPDTGLRTNLRFTPQRPDRQCTRDVYAKRLCQCSSQRNGSPRCTRHGFSARNSVSVNISNSKDDSMSECTLTLTPSSVAQSHLGFNEVDALGGTQSTSKNVQDSLRFHTRLE